MQFDAPIFRCMYMHFVLLINYNSIIRNLKKSERRSSKGDTGQSITETKTKK